MTAPAVLRVPAYLLDAAIKDARAQHPQECCGFFSGKDGKPTDFIPIRNVHPDPERFFEMSVQDTLVAFRRMDETGTDPLVVYHSHTSVGTELSGSDIRLAVDLSLVYLVVSTARSSAQPSFQAWRIKVDEEGDKIVEEVALDIVDNVHPDSPLFGLVQGNKVRMTYDSTAGRRTIVCTIGGRSSGGEAVTVKPARLSAGGPELIIALDRIRSISVLQEGSTAARTRDATAEVLRTAADLVQAGDTLGCRDALARAQGLMPRITPLGVPVPRPYRPRRRGE